MKCQKYSFAQSIVQLSYSFHFCGPFICVGLLLPNAPSGSMFGLLMPLVDWLRERCLVEIVKHREAMLATRRM